VTCRNNPSHSSQQTTLRCSQVLVSRTLLILMLMSSHLWVAISVNSNKINNKCITKECTLSNSSPSWEAWTLASSDMLNSGAVCQDNNSISSSSSLALVSEDSQLASQASTSLVGLRLKYSQ